ncbi:unnamed protein product, partial [Ectocarpus sp. 13 AM-2016]
HAYVHLHKRVRVFFPAVRLANLKGQAARVVAKLFCKYPHDLKGDRRVHSVFASLIPRYAQDWRIFTGWPDGADDTTAKQKHKHAWRLFIGEPVSAIDANMEDMHTKGRY